MKVLHVIPSYEPAWAFGGTVTATVNLCRALAKKGIDVTVYTTDADGKGGYLNVPLNEPVDLGGVKVWYFHCDFLPSDAFYSRGLANKLDETIKDFDLVHVSAIWQWIQVDVYKACKKFNKPYIVTSHGSFNPWPWNQKKLKKKMFWHLFQNQTIKNANAIHFTAEDERMKSFLAVRLLKKKSSFVIPNGIEIQDKNKVKNIRKNLGIPDEKFIILYAGRIQKQKRIEIIIHALRRIKEDNIIFLVVGPKEEEEYFNDLVKLSEGLNNIVWHEPVPREHIWDFYYSSNLLILLSYDENFGYTIVEGMSIGLPVLINKNICIWKEIQEDKAGFVVDDKIEEICQIIEKCLVNPEILKELSSNARKSAEKRYDINKVADLMIKAYEDVLSGRRSQELKWV